MRKKIIVLLMLTLLLSFPVSAAEKRISVQIPVSCSAKNSSETFQYQILPETTQFQDLESDTLSLKDGETGEFQISYQVPGTYHYTVRQLKGDRPRTAYDETVYSVDVYVTEKEDGTMAAEAITYRKPEAEKKDCLSFVNTVSIEQGGFVDSGDTSYAGWILLMAGSFILIIVFIRRKEKK